MPRTKAGTITINGLEQVSYTQLLALRQRIDQLLSEKRHAELSTARQRIASIAKEHGFKVPEVLGSKRKGRKLGKVAPKYQDPKNPGNTWTGRGRPPLWFAAYLRRGKKRDDLLIGR